jgi:hypothetical protein
MNLFRSEEHIHNRTQFNPASEEGIIALNDLVKLFSCELFRRRLDPDYLSQRHEYLGGFWKILTELGETRPFCYKLIWFIGVVFPLIVSGTFPLYAILHVIIMGSYIIGDLIAIPFPYVFSRTETTDSTPALETV